MTISVRVNLTGRLKRLEKLALYQSQADRAAPASDGRNPAAYPDDPTGYARDILGVILSPDQERILRHLLIPPCKVMVPSAHDTGKTFVAAVAVNWWYDSFNPGVVTTTAPTRRDVVDLLWTEVRLQRQRASLPMHFIGPAAPEMRTSGDHWAKGYTASKGESFQGRHRPRMLFIKDEANGVDLHYWVGTSTMFDPQQGHAELNIYNPTDPTSAAKYYEDLTEPDGTPRYHVFRLSALNHPNVLADLRGEQRPIPGAVNAAMVSEWVKDWCEPLKAEDVTATDIEWPPESGRFYRPGPIFQARALGLWPDLGEGVWSDQLFAACLHGSPILAAGAGPEAGRIGCDTATGKGDDYHAIHARIGNVSIHHETSNTMDPVRIYGRLRECCQLVADRLNASLDPAAEPVKAKGIRINIDDDGTGNAVGAFLRRDGYKVSLIGAGTAAAKPELYPAKRSELWFQVAQRARMGLLYLGLIDVATRRRLKQQLLAPAWDIDSAGRRRVEKKDVTKEKIGRSPDDADAMNLAYYEGTGQAPEAVERSSRDGPGGNHFARGRR